LLKLGYGLKDVLLYYAVLHLVDVPLNFFARRLVILYGASAEDVLATIASIAYFLVFNNLVGGGLLILLSLAVLDALYDTLYWVAHMYLFVESSIKADNAGKSTGLLFTVRSLAGKLGPAIGAGILLFGSKHMLIAATILFFLLSIIPLIKLRHVKNKPNPRKLSFKEFFSEFREKKDYLSLMLFQIHSTMEGVLWPLFIYTIFNTLNSIGAIALIVSVSTIAFSYFAGVLSKKNQYLLIMGGSLCIIFMWMLRMVASSELAYYASTFAMAFFAVVVSIPLESNIIARARAKDTLTAVTIRNAATMLPQIFIFALLLVVVSIFNVSFLIAVGSLLVLMAVTNIFLSIGNKSIA